jgi:hypothetical protein
MTPQKELKNEKDLSLLLGKLKLFDRPIPLRIMRYEESKSLKNFIDGNKNKSPQKADIKGKHFKRIKIK